jgi:hypothetical protein
MGVVIDLAWFSRNHRLNLRRAIFARIAKSGRAPEEVPHASTAGNATRPQNALGRAED